MSVTIVQVPKARRICLYCGGHAKRGKRGEHVIPEAIGGALTLNDVPNRSVCHTCNNGVLSVLDDELCSRSYLSIIASRELGSAIWQAWDVDHSDDNLLMEAKPDWATDEAFNSLVCYPQIIFEDTGPVARGDSEEFIEFGLEDAVYVLFKAARLCFQRHRQGDRGALTQRLVRSSVTRGDYRLPPRLYSPHSINEIASEIQTRNFVLRYDSPARKRRAMLALEKLREYRSSATWAKSRGSFFPSVGCYFDIGLTLRALMKLGINLLAAICSRTPVDKHAFALPISFIRGKAERLTPALFKTNGFVHAEDVQRIAVPGNAHSFRVAHDGRFWYVLSSFFGGKIGALVQLAGPNHESWRSAHVVAPLKSKDWVISTSQYLPFFAPWTIAWHDSSLIIPSFKLYNSVSGITIEAERRRPPKI